MRSSSLYPICQQTFCVITSSAKHATYGIDQWQVNEQEWIYATIPLIATKGICNKLKPCSGRGQVKAKKTSTYARPIAAWLKCPMLHRYQVSSTPVRTHPTQTRQPWVLWMGSSTTRRKLATYIFFIKYRARTILQTLVKMKIKKRCYTLVSKFLFLSPMLMRAL